MDGHILLALFHLLAIVPFFLYVGLQRSATPPIVYTVLLSLGVIITLYHGYKAWVRYMASSPYLYVNIIHFLYLGPLLIYIGAKGRDAPRWAYEVLLMFAFAAGGYHLYSLVQQMNNVRTDEQKSS
jgi:hypothetical protein